MGNHNVGRAMDMGARLFWKFHKDRSLVTQEQALEALDIMGEEFRGSDAEFDDYAQPGEPLGDLMAKAFGYVEPPEGDDQEDLWYETVYDKMTERYDFC